MTLAWLFLYVIKGMPLILSWWPPHGWVLGLYICIALDLGSK